MNPDGFISNFTEWAADQPEIVAVVLIGSHARGEAGPESDIDLVVVTTVPGKFLDNAAWTETFGIADSLTIEDWGRVQSVRVFYNGGPEVEFGITAPDWAAKPDDATRDILSKGHKVLLDRNEIFASG